MRNNNHAFPWGIYIGDLTDEKDTLPVCLPSQKGGFCVLFDDHSEATANNLIENVALKLFEVLPIGDICVDVIDFTHKRRFMQLSSFKDVGLYQIAFSADEATRKFNDLEKIALHRHHDLLSPEVETLPNITKPISLLKNIICLLSIWNIFQKI